MPHIRRVLVTLGLALMLLVPSVAVANAAPSNGCTLQGKARMLCKGTTPYRAGQRPPSGKQWLFCGAGFLTGNAGVAAAFCLVDMAWRD